MKLRWKITASLAIVGLIYVVFLLHSDGSAQKDLEQTRQALRAQGFKTDLADFNFSTDAASRARESALTVFNTPLQFGPSGDRLELMPMVTEDSVIVVWRQEWLTTESGAVHWPDLREALDENRPELDAACDAALSGPVRFDLDASKGGAMLLRHLAPLRNLALTLGERVVLELHDGNTNAAWTNLLAATRFVRAWEPEPTEVSHLFRFSLTTSAFNDTWQALQNGGWPDDKLARLQAEWEAVDFFKNLPETAAFKLASSADMCQQNRREPLPPGFALADFFKELAQSPKSAWSGLTYYWNQLHYRSYGTYADEKALLLFYRDRELELRNAVQAANWSQMQRLPGVTNKIFFQSEYRSRLQSVLNIKELSTAFLKQGSSFLGRAAEAEARRRIIITAIALERYHEQRGAYPKTLTELAPDFLKVVPVDFMDGGPLRYRPTDDGHFVLYSVGLDCVDDGGQIQTREQRIRASREGLPFELQPNADIVWPRPASATEVASQHQAALDDRAQQADEDEEQSASAQWSLSDRRQAGVEKILAEKTVPIGNAPEFHGRPLNEVLHNQNSSGTNLLSLDEMLALKQVIAGGEPETVTFQAPIAFDVLTNIGSLALGIDFNKNEESDDGFIVNQTDCERAANGDCLLVWNTIYESPGKHALQMVLTVNELSTDRQEISGRVAPFIVSNLCQFSLGSARFDPETGATFHVRLPEQNGSYVIELNTTNGARLKTFSGSTSNSVIKVFWDLTDDHGRRFTNDFFDSVFHITLPDSGRTQTLKGP